MEAWRPDDPDNKYYKESDMANHRDTPPNTGIPCLAGLFLIPFRVVQAIVYVFIPR